MKTNLLSLIVAPFFGTLSAAPVTLPYANDFSSNADDFNASGYYSVIDSKYNFDAHFSGTARLALLNVPEIGSTVTDFTISTTLSAVDTDGDGSFGFALFSVDNVSSGQQIIVDWSPSSLLRIYNGYTASMISSATTTDFTFQDNVEYSLTVIGHLFGTSLDLDLSISDGVNTETIVASDIDVSSYLSNLNFGYRTYSPSAHELIVNYDDFSISTIPEPSTMAGLLGSMALGLVLLRRRKYVRSR